MGEGGDVLTFPLVGEEGWFVKGGGPLPRDLSPDAFYVIYTLCGQTDAYENITSLPCSTLFAGNNNSGLIFVSQ